METRKLKSLPYGQAHINVSDDDNVETLVSYETNVILKIKNFQGSGRTAYRLNGLYSRTTIKHISLYMREENIGYYNIKPCANTEWLLVIGGKDDDWSIAYYNQDTGEFLIPADDGVCQHLPNRYYVRYNLDHEKYSDLIYYDGTYMAGYWRY